jgi:hypothetical protein
VDTTHAERALVSAREPFAMSDFAFKVNLVAVVRVRAADETTARKVVLTVLGAPGAAEIGLANQNNAAVGLDAMIVDVDFSGEGGSIKPVEIDRKSDLNGTGATATYVPAPATRFRPSRPSTRSSSSVSDIDTVVVDSLKALDPQRPIREADIGKLSPTRAAKKRRAVINSREPSD